MQEEILYHVTENNEIIGPVAKSLAHQDPSLLHREVAVALKDEAGNLLIAKRSDKKKVLPGKWDITCAGHVPYGMTTKEAAHMELKEELGFDTSLERIGRQIAFYDWESHLSELYIGVYRGEKITIEEEEVSAWMLASREEIESMGDQFNREFLDFAEAVFLDEYRGLEKSRKDLRSC